MNENNLEEDIDEDKNDRRYSCLIETFDRKVALNMCKDILINSIISILVILPYILVNVYSGCYCHRPELSSYIVALSFDVLSLLYLSFYKESSQQKDIHYKMSVYLCSVTITILVHSAIFSI